VFTVAPELRVLYGRADVGSVRSSRWPSRCRGGSHVSSAGRQRLAGDARPGAATPSPCRPCRGRWPPPVGGWRGRNGRGARPVGACGAVRRRPERAPVPTGGGRAGRRPGGAPPPGLGGRDRHGRRTGDRRIITGAGGGREVVDVGGGCPPRTAASRPPWRRAAELPFRTRSVSERVDPAELGGLRDASDGAFTPAVDERALPRAQV
jgi:hypothetical protein